MSKVIYNFHKTSDSYTRWKPTKTTFNNFLTNNQAIVGNPNKFDLSTQVKRDRYKQFFKFTDMEMSEIGTDVAILIQKVKDTKFDELFEIN